MLGRHSIDRYQSFIPDREERFLQPNMHTLLFKMGPSRCNSTFLLEHIKATITFLMDFTYNQKQFQRENYRLALL
jgi:hypothetical protein